MVVLEHLSHCILSVQMIERQGEQTKPGLGTKTLTLMRRPEPGRRSYLPDHREVSGPQRHDAQGLTAHRENPEPKPPVIHRPTGQLGPVLTENEARTVLRRALGPRGQERALPHRMHTPPGQHGKLTKLVIVRKSESKACGSDVQLVSRPEVRDHASHFPAVTRWEAIELMLKSAYGLDPVFRMRIPKRRSRDLGQLVARLTNIAKITAAGLTVQMLATVSNHAPITSDSIPAATSLTCGVSSNGHRTLAGSVLALGSQPIPWK